MQSVHLAGSAAFRGLAILWYMYYIWASMADTPRKISVVFYRTRSGVETVRDWLRDLDDGDRNAVGQDLMRVQYRWPVGMPLCRPLGEGLWEVRSSLPSNRIARVLFSVHQSRILALHGFIKKTQKTPDEDLALARRRKREFES
jgi:phage-related protein